MSCTKRGPSSSGIPSFRLSALFLSLVCFAPALTRILFAFHIDVSVWTDVAYKLLEYHVSTFLTSRRFLAAPLIKSISSRIDPRHRPSDYISPPSRPFSHFFLPQGFRCQNLSRIARDYWRTIGLQGKRMG